MTVNELIEALRSFPPDADIYMEMNHEYYWPVESVRTDRNGRPLISDDAPAQRTTARQEGGDAK